MTSAGQLLNAEQRELSWRLAQCAQEKVTTEDDHILCVGTDAKVISDWLRSNWKFNAEWVDVSETERIKWFPKCGKKHYGRILINNSLPDLKDDNINGYLDKLMSLLTEGGYLLFRENLNAPEKNLSSFTHIFNSFKSKADQSGSQWVFQFSGAFQIKSSIYTVKTWLDYCWIFRKAPDTEETTTFQGSLDQQQYSVHGILAYEWIFGSGFISPGGPEQNRKFIEMLKLTPGEVVLDVGSGTGGNAFQMAQEFGAHVNGVDISSNMVSIASERANHLRDPRIQFLVVDATKFDFPLNSFDVVYSRDTIIHIPDKKDLFARFFRWLKPGGRVQFTDYNVGEKVFTPAFKDFIANRRQFVWRSIHMYTETLKEVGFQDVEGIDVTELFEKTTRDEMVKFEKSKSEFCQFSTDQYDSSVKRWQNWLGFIADGDQKWGLFKAVKPH